VGEAMSRIEGPSDTRHGDIPVGVEVQPGKTTGQLKVFDTGVPHFPNTAEQGASPAGDFTRLVVAQNVPSSLNDLLANTRNDYSNMAHIVAKRSITLLADSGNGGTVYVGDKYTDASAFIGFPLAAGASITLEITNGSEIFLDSTTATQYVHWIAV